jgi:hypothetical protein
MNTRGSTVTQLQYLVALTCPLAKPTAKSAMKLSSVSPLLWLTITPQPAALESRAAWIDSVTVPI